MNENTSEEPIEKMVPQENQVSAKAKEVDLRVERLNVLLNSSEDQEKRLLSLEERVAALDKRKPIENPDSSGIVMYICLFFFAALASCGIYHSLFGNKPGGFAIIGICIVVCAAGMFADIQINVSGLSMEASINKSKKTKDVENISGLNLSV